VSVLIKGHRALFKVLKFQEGAQLYFRDFILIPFSMGPTSLSRFEKYHILTKEPESLNKETHPRAGES